MALSSRFIGLGRLIKTSKW